MQRLKVSVETVHEFEFDVIKPQLLKWKEQNIISTSDGKTDALANDLLSMNQVTVVGKSIGEHTNDLRVETIVEDNHELLDILEFNEKLKLEQPYVQFLRCMPN